MNRTCREGEPLGSFSGYGLRKNENGLINPSINGACSEHCQVSCKIKFAKRAGGPTDITQAKDLIKKTAADAITTSRNRG